jgi:hypothetical protein
MSSNQISATHQEFINNDADEIWSDANAWNDNIRSGNRSLRLGWIIDACNRIIRIVTTHKYIHDATTN